MTRKKAGSTARGRKRKPAAELKSRVIRVAAEPALDDWVTHQALIEGISPSAWTARLLREVRQEQDRLAQRAP